MQVLNIFHVLIAIALVAFILIQKGQGATAGAAFGSGASGTVFGARGAGNFLSRTTWVLAALFCTISLVMAVMVSRTSALPENDLGVLGSGQTQDQTQTLETPVIDTATDNVDGYGVQTSGAVDDLPGDLPALDSEASEKTVIEEAQAVTDGSDG